MKMLYILPCIFYMGCNLVHSSSLLSNVRENASIKTTPSQLTKPFLPKAILRSHCSKIIRLCDSSSFSNLKEKLLFVQEYGKPKSMELNLWYNEFSDGQALDLSEILSRYPDLSTLKLDLGNNPLSMAGLRVISTSISQLRSLTNLFLQLRYIKIDDNILSVFVSFFQQLKELKILSFDLGDNSISNLGLNALVQALAGCTNLHFLHLGLDENRLTEGSGDTIKRLFPMLPRLQGIHLNFSVNDVTNNDLQLLLDAFGLSKVMKSIALDTSHTRVDQEKQREIISTILKIPQLRLAMFEQSALCNLCTHEYKKNFCLNPDLEVRFKRFSPSLGECDEELQKIGFDPFE